MPEINDEITFETEADQVQFRTQTNGDQIRIEGIDLEQDEAATMAWLVNADSDAILEINIKVKP